MGLFDFLSGQFIDVIEWVDYSRDMLVWKYPDQDKEIKMGAQLTVRESQAAILINEGKMADVFEAGRYELVTRNMPILTTLRSWKHGFDSPFKVDVYFFNTRQFIDNKWGTTSPVTIPDSKYGQIDFRAYGTYNFKITNFELFFKEVVGTHPALRVDDVDGMLRGKLVDRFGEVVAEMADKGFSFVEMQRMKSEFTEALLPRVKHFFDDFGLEITDFSIQGITLPDELTDALRKNTQMNMVGDLQRFTQFQMATAMEKSAENPGGGNIGADIGTGMAMANMMNQTFQNSGSGGGGKDDIIKMLKELGELKEAGVLTEEEFSEKKKQLLDRI